MAHHLKPTPRESALAPSDTSARVRLLQAAVELFNQRGYAATSVGEIVEAAGVTKPVLYYHFDSKEGIYLAMMHEGAERLLGILARPTDAGDSPAGIRLRRLCAQVLEFSFDHLPVIRVMYGIYYGPPQGAPHVDFDSYHAAIRGRIIALVREGIARAEFRDEDPQLVTLVIVGILSACLESRLCHAGLDYGTEHLDRSLQMLFRGLAPDPNREEGPPR